MNHSYVLMKQQIGYAGGHSGWSTTGSMLCSKELSWAGLYDWTPTSDNTLLNSTHGLSRRYDGSHHHHEWALLWARSPIRERHIRWQIWHSKLLVDGGPDLRRSRLASNSWMRRTSNSSTADLHVECQPVLSIASVSSSEGVMPHWVIVLFRQSLYHLYCPPGRRKPWWS